MCAPIATSATLNSSSTLRRVPLGTARLALAPALKPFPIQRTSRPSPGRRCSAPVTMVATPFLFTPVESGLGGLTLGLMSYAKFRITGRVLGISGAVKGLIFGSQEVWRVAFVAGLLAGGFALRGLLPGAFEVLPEAYTVSRVLLAGLLVGLGTARGSGCTSGHGIAGNARLSIRSFAATCTFMLSGAVAAHLSGIAAVFGLPSGLAPLAPLAPLSPAATFGTTLLLLAATTKLVLWVAARQLTSPARAPSPAVVKSELQQATALEKTGVAGAPPSAAPDAQKIAALSTASDLFIGLFFALALGVSGMIKPSKVAGFLSVLSGTFDPSLMCVMGGALLVALPAFQLALRTSSRPLCAACFDLPLKKAVDANLITGALLFGAGWGLGGICPGPGLVAAATLQPKALLWVGAMSAGMQLDRLADNVAAKLVAPADG